MSNVVSVYSNVINFTFYFCLRSCHVLLLAMSWEPLEELINTRLSKSSKMCFSSNAIDYSCLHVFLCCSHDLKTGAGSSSSHDLKTGAESSSSGEKVSSNVRSVAIS